MYGAALLPWTFHQERDHVVLVQENNRDDNNASGSATLHRTFYLHADNVPWDGFRSSRRNTN